MVLNKIRNVSYSLTASSDSAVDAVETRTRTIIAHLLLRIVSMTLMQKNTMHPILNYCFIPKTRIDVVGSLKKLQCTMTKL